MLRRQLLAMAGTLAVAMLQASTPAHAQAFPTRTIQIISPFAAGGMLDVVVRPLALALQKELGQPVIIVNKPGAGGGIGTQQVANAEADGHTLLITLSSITTLPAIAKVTGQPGPFEREQFEPLARFAADPALVFVHHDAPWKTIDDLIADAKSKPDKLTFSSSGRNGPTHLPVAMLSQATGTSMVHVPATGGGPAMLLLLGKNVDLFFTVPALGAEHVKAGTLRALATSSAKRAAAFPDVPTLKEKGIDVEYVVWAGLFAPKGIPDAVKAKLEAAIAKAVADPQYGQLLASAGVELAYQDAKTFKAWWDADAEKTEQVLRLINSRPGN